MKILKKLNDGAALVIANDATRRNGSEHGVTALDGVAKVMSEVA